MSLVIKAIIIVFLICAVVLCFVFFKTKRKELALVLVSSLLALVIGEIGLRLFLPQINSYGEMLTYDSILGWKFVPNGRGPMAHRGIAPNIIETNSWGFRDRAPSVKKNNKLMVLGDSFVSNIAVEDDEVFTEIMENQLKEHEVMNFGVNAFSVVQEYLLLKEWIDIVDPDAVILMIYLQNDFIDNMGAHWLYERPFATLEGKDSLLTIHKQSNDQRLKIKKSYGNPFAKFHFNWLVTRTINNLFPATDSLYVTAEFYTCQSPVPDDYRVPFKIMEELLLKTDSLCKGKNVPIVFALVPSIIQVDDELWNDFLKRNAVSNKRYVRSSPNDRLMQFANVNNLLMLDLLPVFLAEKQSKAKFYHPVEQHWTKEGNQLVAKTLINYLRSRSLTE